MEEQKWVTEKNLYPSSCCNYEKTKRFGLTHIIHKSFGRCSIFLGGSIILHLSITHEFMNKGHFDV